MWKLHLVLSNRSGGAGYTTETSSQSGPGQPVKLQPKNFLEGTGQEQPAERPSPRDPIKTSTQSTSQSYPQPQVCLQSFQGSEAFLMTHYRVIAHELGLRTEGNPSP